MNSAFSLKTPFASKPEYLFFLFSFKPFNMSTLYEALISQHSRTLQPVLHTEQMTQQLQAFFELVVLENNLPALVIESLPQRRERQWREVERMRQMGRTARYPFFIVAPDDELTRWFQAQEKSETEDAKSGNLILLPRSPYEIYDEHFLIISDSQFSAVLCAARIAPAGSALPADKNYAICSCDPDVVYTALEYLQARVTVEHREHAALLTEAIRESQPKITSLHLTLSVTTKLAGLWQEQTGREIAVNRIATAIRRSLELDEVLQTAVNEVGATLNVDCCTLLIEPATPDEEIMAVNYFRQRLAIEEMDTIDSDLSAYRKRLKNNPQPYIRDGVAQATNRNQAEWGDKPMVVIPLVFLEQFVGVLFARDDKPTRVWQENEIMLLETVADQVAIAINHSRLYVKSQREALRDSLTGVFNRRYFEMQFEREMNLAERTDQPLSLLVVDLDHFKSVNDNYGHSAGDDVLRTIARRMKSRLRNFDTIARYGGEEFFIILPRTNTETALIVAERLRKTVAEAEFSDCGSVTISLGAATFPDHASTGADLRILADRALYCAKGEGRNRVCLPPVEEREEKVVMEEDELLDLPTGELFTENALS
jgi:diguanylate cyclase (GGDEF)-like protein